MMTATWLGLSSPLTCFLIHLGAVRLCRPQIAAQKLVALVIVANCALLATAAYFLTAELSQSLHAAILAMLFGYTYFHWFNMSETARRIRILVLFVAHGVTPKAETYNALNIFENRIERLQSTGTIFERDGRFMARSGPLLFATRVILFWRSLFYPRGK